MTIDDSNLMGEEIAVYYCQGSIVRMETPSIYDSEQQIVSTKVIKDLAGTCRQQSGKGRSSAYQFGRWRCRCFGTDTGEQLRS